ncbi:putative PEP-binding protein [Actinotalea fermentans]|uniref:Phosphoenolpyruvate-protein phosphotransferase n=1 Tax=Actinotalea fermentans TaxID=43671 RepID=A0A511Z008_9CELL|nr:putative PEP-binding protein [Actinotalea fermentans]GEN80772.1 phosphoenolpyruvate-protein phosphotransferase [Actinotalea fermentans]
MTTLHGAGVGRGAAVGPVARAHLSPPVPDGPADPDREAATRAAEAAFAAVADALDARARDSSGTVAGVLGAAAAMARDSELIGQVRARIGLGQAAPFAVDRAVAEFVDLFGQDPFLAERVTDLLSVRDRVVARLLGLPEPGVPALAVPSVVVARDLAPADTAALELDKVLAIVIEQGGPTGHTAIIAGQLGIPCVVRVAGAGDLADGTEVAVDAAAGTVVVAPDDDVRARVAARREALASLALRRDPGATADGHPVALLANIGTAEDAERLTGAAVEGVGLFRTEVLFLGRTDEPTQAEQADAYARAFAALGGRKVVVRTLDAGADKPLAFVTRGDEENPALGVRGFRLVRGAEALVRGQLAAIARAAERTGTDPWVMAPMVATVEEAAQFAALARAAGVRTVGVMVEVPSVALRARDVLAEVDFVSIGTNDLAQYTMATDRLLGDLADLLDPWQPAVLDLVAATASAAAETGKPAGVCGESAADPLMALVLVGLGVTSLSMSPAAVPGVRFALSRHTRARCAELAATARAARTAGDARAACLALADPEVREVLALG